MIALKTNEHKSTLAPQWNMIPDGATANYAAPTISKDTPIRKKNGWCYCCFFPGFFRLVYLLLLYVVHIKNPTLFFQIGVFFAIVCVALFAIAHPAHLRTVRSFSTFHVGTMHHDE